MKYVLAALVMVAASNVFALGAGGGGDNRARAVKPENTVRSNAAAAERLDALAAQQREQQARLDTDSEKADKALTDARAELARLQTTATNAERDFDASGTNWLGVYSTKSDALRTKWQDAKKKFDDQTALVTQLDTARNNVIETGRQIDTTNVDLAQTQVSLDNQVRGLRMAITQQGMLASYDRMLQYFDNEEDRLNAIEAQIDKTLMGAYLQDKIAMLVNSQTICDAYSRCKVGDPAKVPNERIKSELFPSSQSMRLDSYESINTQKRRNAPMNRSGQAK